MAGASTTTRDGLGSPPRPPLAFRVGVVGHRPDRLKHADLRLLESNVSDALRAVQDEVLRIGAECASLFDGSTPVLRAISPLAEGSDRLFAEAALSLGFELCCVMPFPQEVFERDFLPPHALEKDSLKRFRGILDRARTQTRLSVFEMDGTHPHPDAYGAAGRVVLNQSDLLVVVWDGLRKGKRGGTEETFTEARQRGVPVVWIDAHAPHAWQLLDSSARAIAHNGDRTAPDGSGSIEALRRWVREAVELPRPTMGPDEDDRHAAHGDDPKELVETYVNERRPRRSYAVPWRVFRDLFGDGTLPRVSLAVPPYEDDLLPEWPRDRATPVGILVDQLRPYYAWADKLSVLYADRYRSAFVAAFILAASAVGLALIPVGAGFRLPHWVEAVCIMAELGVIGAILFAVYQGRRKRWHERWIDYRIVAELVRHLRLIAPLGGQRPFPQVPAHWATYGQPSASWMAWYVRGIERAVGLPAARVDREYILAYLDHVAAVLGGDHGQIAYHRRNAQRSHRLEHNLHVTGIVLLCLTLLAGTLHLLPHLWHGFVLPKWLPAHFLTFLCGFLPALGAATQGIVNQGEFRRVSRRSKSMQSQLEALLTEVQALRAEIARAPEPAPEQYSAEAVRLGADAARLLVNEVLDWRVVFLDQPLKPPT